MSTVATSTLLGRPLWYELMTTDPKAAETFYDRVVGWTSAPFPPSPQPYTVFNRKGGTPVAGVMATPEGMKAPPFWAMYVGVVKLEETAAKIKRLGGSECSPVIEVPTVGRMQMMKDPQGAAFYIYEPSSAEQPARGGRRGRRRVVARADDVRRAGGNEVLQRRVRVAAQRVTRHGRDGQVPHVQPSPRNDRRHDEPAARNGARTAQLAGLFPRAGHHAAVERIKSNGGKILNGPMEVPGGDWVVNAMDPQGAAFALHAKAANV